MIKKTERREYKFAMPLCWLQSRDDGRCRLNTKMRAERESKGLRKKTCAYINSKERKEKKKKRKEEEKEAKEKKKKEEKSTNGTAKKEDRKTDLTTILTALRLPHSTDTRTNIFVVLS